MAVMFLRLTYPQKQLHATLKQVRWCRDMFCNFAVLLRLTLYDLLHAPAVLDYKAEMKEMYQSDQHVAIAQLYGTDAKRMARWVGQ